MIKTSVLGGDGKTLILEKLNDEYFEKATALNGRIDVDTTFMVDKVQSEVEVKEKLRRLDEEFSRSDVKIKMSVLGEEEKYLKI